MVILKHTRIILFLIFSLSFPFTGLAQHYYFKQISVQEGLSQPTVQSILSDSKRSLWLGTKNGLNNFNGYEIENYIEQANDSTSILGNNIFFISEDSQKQIWVGTQKGVCQYLTKDKTFIPLLYNSKPINSRSCVVLRDEVIFVGIGILYRYNCRTQKVQATKMSGLTGYPYFTLAKKWDENTLLVAGRWTSVYWIDVATGKATPFSVSDIQNITALHIENNKRIWIAQYNKGIACFTPHGVKLNNYTTENSGLKNNIILDFLMKPQALWMATDGGGINILNLHTNKISSIEHIPGDPSTLPVNSITCLYEDEEGNIWAGTVRGGALGIRQVYMKTYLDAPLGSSYGLSEKSIISIIEDSDKNLWIGTDGGGINQFNPRNNRFRHFPNTYKEKVNSIYEFNKDELLISIYGKGLFRFNKKNGKSIPMLIINERLTDSIYSTGIPVLIHPGKNNEFYIFGSKIFVYQPTAKQFTTIYDNTHKWIQPFYHSKKFSLLISEDAIYKLTHIDNKINIIWSIDNEGKIAAACFDGQHTLYIGMTSGMRIYDIYKQKTIANNTPLFPSITTMIMEKNDRIWIGAKNKLYAYNPVKNRYLIYGASDGVLPNELLSRPSLLTSQDEIYFGGNMGLLRIYRNMLSDTFYKPELQLTQVETDRKTYILNEKTENNLRIPWNFKRIRFNFMVKDGNYFRDKHFKYIIKGNKTIHIEATKPYFTLNTLSTGDYMVHAQCDMQDGSWTKPILCLTLSITPPWWKTPLALFLYTAIILCCILAGAMFYIQKKKNRLKWQMKEHEQKINEEKIQFLININHELRTPLTLIYGILKRTIDEDREKNYHLRDALKHTQRMKNIINMVLDIRKMEVGKETLNYSTCNLNEWITAKTVDFLPEFKTKGIDLIINTDPRIRNLVMDKDKSEKAFINILSNALKFSNTNSKVTVSTLLMEDWIRITIADQGIGLGDDPEKLFQRFYQGKHNRGGTGIGLSYSKLMIEIQGGRINARNNESRGATFSIDLPIRTDNDFPKSAKGDSISFMREIPSRQNNQNLTIPDINLKQYSILIVEDEPDLRQFIKEMFTKKFKKVLTAENGEIGFIKVIDYQPDIVISDIMMPGVNGYTLCHKIKNDLRCSHIPVILLTALEDKQSKIFGYKTGADAYLSKPFESEVLISLVEAQIKNREYVRMRYKKNEPTIVTIQDVTFSNADEIFLEKFNQLIEQNIGHSFLNVQFLAKEMGMSRASLYNKVNQLLGIGINDYISKQRMAKAEELVTHTEMSMQEIADKTGFSSQRYFSKVFKLIYGMPPTKYREVKGKIS